LTVSFLLYCIIFIFRYGFILNACVSDKDDGIYFVHISGGMLAYIISDVYNVHKARLRVANVTTEQLASPTLDKSPLDIGFFWCWNFCLGKKWRSSSTGDEKYQGISFFYISISLLSI